MKKNELPKPPSHLTPASKSWWQVVVENFELEPHHLKLLQAAAESWDRLQSARAVLDKEGISYLDRFGAPRARPEVAVERDAKIAFARLVRELRLDDIPPPEAARPPALNR
jgi:phage terminase small subunit